LDRLAEPDTRGDPDSPLRWTCGRPPAAASLGRQPPLQGSLAPERNRLRERIDRESTPAFTQLPSCCVRNRTSRRGVPVAAYPTKDLDRLCSRATLDRGPLGTSRSLEDRGWTHHELHPGPVGGSTPGRPGVLPQPDLEGRPSPTLGSAAPPAAACQRGWVSESGPHPAVKVGSTVLRFAESFSPAVPPACHKQRARAVSSGQSRSLRGTRWAGRTSLTCGGGGGRNCMACKGSWRIR